MRTPGKHDQDAIEDFFRERGVRNLAFSHDALHSTFTESGPSIKESLERSRTCPGFSWTVQRLYQEDRLFTLEGEVGNVTGVRFLKSKIKLTW